MFKIEFLSFHIRCYKLKAEREKAGSDDAKALSFIMKHEMRRREKSATRIFELSLSGNLFRW